MNFAVGVSVSTNEGCLRQGLHIRGIDDKRGFDVPAGRGEFIHVTTEFLDHGMYISALDDAFQDFGHRFLIQEIQLDEDDVSHLSEYLIRV